MAIVKMSLIKEREFVRVPQKAHASDVGYDAFVSQINIRPDGLIKYKLGFRTEMPENYAGKVVPRGSFTKVNFVMNNSEGVIDPNYRGEWEFRIRPLNPGTQKNGLSGDTLGGYSRRNLPYNVGDPCCQIYFEKKNDVELVLDDNLSTTDRGEGAFGHTNNKIYGKDI